MPERYGIRWTARAMRLDYYALKKRVRQEAPAVPGAPEAAGVAPMIESRPALDGTTTLPTAPADSLSTYCCHGRHAAKGLRGCRKDSVYWTEPSGEVAAVSRPSAS